MATSGTYGFSLPNSGVVMEAFDRIQMRPTATDRHMLISARISLNLELQEWSNEGFNLWKLVTGTIPLVPGQIVYLLPVTLIDLTDVYLTTVDTTGGTNSTDRLITPLTRDEYAAIPSKAMPGTVTSYWFQRLAVPQVSLWQPPAIGSPNYVVTWYGLGQIQDANLGSGETPDVVYRGLDALCARLATRLAEKFAPQLWQAKKAISDEAFAKFCENDQEQGPVKFQPNFSGYARM